MKKKIILTISYTLGLIAIPASVFGGYYGWSKSLPNVYTNTYYAALVDKVNLLETHKDDQKIILVGGSNVAFGFNSEKLEEEFPEYKVINFGLYANLGTKIMMDLAKPYINSGDMVFLLPETNEQSLSLYFSPINTWKAIEDKQGIYKLLPEDNQKFMRGNYMPFIKEKKKYKEAIPGAGIYQRANFNKYMDFEYVIDDISQRLQNQMSQKYDPTMTLDYSKLQFDPEFVNYTNEYNTYIEGKEAKLYFGFSPINEMALSNYKEADAVRYYWDLREALDCDVIGNPIEYHIEPNYFFDSNFHLNDAGAILRTKLLANDIYRDILQSLNESKIEVPEKPDYPDIIIGEDSESAKYFNYIENVTGYTITGVKEEYIHLDSLDIPKFLNGKSFNTIAENAFANCDKITSLTLPKTITSLMNGAFANSYKLASIEILYSDPSKIQVDYQGGMTNGVVDGFKIYVPNEGKLAYMTDYYWSVYSSYFIGY